MKMMVKSNIDEKLTLRNFDARQGKIETGAVVTTRRGQRGVGRGKGICYQWKEKLQCSRGDKCSFATIKEKEPQKPKSIWEVRSTAVHKLLGK